MRSCFFMTTTTTTTSTTTTKITTTIKIFDLAFLQPQQQQHQQ